MTVTSLVGAAAASCSAPCVGRDASEPLPQDGEKITISKKPNSCQFILFHHRTADGEFELIEWRSIIPERTNKMNLSMVPPLNSERTYYELKIIRKSGRGPKEKSVEELSGSHESERNRGVRTLTLS